MTDTTTADASVRGKPRLRGHSHANVRLRRTQRYIKSKLAWNRFYRATSYAKSALWIVPFVAIVLVLAAAPALRALDAWLGWRLAGLDIAGAQALYQTVISLTLAFVVFTFGSLLVAIQIAGGQLTPRIIATLLLRDNVVRYSVGLFVFSLLFAVTALNRLEKHVPELVAVLTALLGIACMATFLFLIDYAARLLRPVTIVARVGNEGLAVIKAVYPEPAGDVGDEGVAASSRLGTPRIVTHTAQSEILLAVDLDTLLVEAERLDGVVELVPQVGDFVAHDEPLFALYGGAAEIADRKLRTTVAFGSERTMEQDPMFAFRIVVDIALKALSPAINDPTTAVLALDQIHRLLKAVGKRHLQLEEINDDAGRVRVIYRTPNWEDYVHVACTEIRTCGAGSVQIARRLRALLNDVAASLPEYRRPVLEAERQRLDAVIETLYSIPADLALARIPDSQGLGGSSAARTAGLR
jgi:uncharacterized membrane protein